LDAEEAFDIVGGTRRARRVDVGGEVDLNVPATVAIAHCQGADAGEICQTLVGIDDAITRQIDEVGLTQDQLAVDEECLARIRLDVPDVGDVAAGVHVGALDIARERFAGERVALAVHDLAVLDDDLVGRRRRLGITREEPAAGPVTPQKSKLSQFRLQPAGSSGTGVCSRTSEPATTRAALSITIASSCSVEPEVITTGCDKERLDREPEQS
jgi:hypothetical protein